MAKILVVDDEVNIIKTLCSILEDEGHKVFSAASGAEALNFFKKNEVDLAILDVWLPDLDGVVLLERLKQLMPDLSIIMISGHGSIDIAVRSTKMGAFDFIPKPPSMERVLTSVNNALEQGRLKKENITLKKELLQEDIMIGASPAILEINDIIQTAAKTNARVFITGESGTGKELVARAIYLRSKRSDKPFIKVNCAAIPDELIESELFGHEKGAFTGALARRSGKFEVADNGTLFLDEVCDMSLSAQAKVLRVLQEQQFERVGGNDTVDVDVRVISATNIDVKKAIEDSRFREDLYYRLNVIPIHVPSLMERADDIPRLVEFFVKKFSDEHGIMMKEVTEDGMQLLMQHTWPGNVRELKNIIERVVIMVPGERLSAPDIRKYIESYERVPAAGASSLKRAREDFEREFIIKALLENDRNVSVTARELGVERTNLYRKIKQYKIDIDGL